MAEMYSIGESGVVMETITVYKNQSGTYVTVDIETTVNGKSVNLKAIPIPRDKFRELVKDVL